MKKNLLCTLAVTCLLTLFSSGLSAQNVINGVYQGSPTSFMYLPTNPGPNDWVVPKYATASTYSQIEATTPGVSGLTTNTDGSGYHSHAFVVRQANGGSGVDCSTCYQMAGNYNNFLNVMAPAWDGSGGFVDTVIQLGDRFGSAGQGNRSQEISYTFIPDTDRAVLLVNYMNSLQNLVNSTHGFGTNPNVRISVTSANGQLLPLGYYPNDYYTDFTGWSNGSNDYHYSATVNGNFGPHGPWTMDYNNNPDFEENTLWPYAEYIFAAPGLGDYVSSTYLNGNTYYPQRVNLTPSFVDANYMPYDCPYAQLTSSCCYKESPHGVVAYPYVIVAFNLIEQARNHEPVKLTIKKHGCRHGAHWAEMYFTAKMVSGILKADISNRDPSITLEVPWGFKNYQWCHALHEDSIRTTEDNDSRTMILNRYDPNRQLWPYYCCMIESFTGVPFVYKAYFRVFDIKPMAVIEQYSGNCAFNFRFVDSTQVSMLTPVVENGEPTGTYDTTVLHDYKRTWLVKDEAGNITRFDGGHREDSFFTKSWAGTEDEAELLAQYTAIGLAIQNADSTVFDTAWFSMSFDRNCVMPSERKDTVTTCETTLAYDLDFFGPYYQQLGEENPYIWTTPGTRVVRYPGMNMFGCDSIVTVTYEVLQPVVDEIVSLDEFCDAFHTTLQPSIHDAEEPVEYTWHYRYHEDTTFNEGVDPTAPEITVSKPGTYSLDIVDANGCGASNQITIDACKPFIVIPNAISPSSHDGLNDCLEIQQRDLLESIEFCVYNRGGDLVYYTRDKNFCWDGTVNGALHKNVTYNWVLKVVDYNGAKSIHKGSVIVL